MTNNLAEILALMKCNFFVAAEFFVLYDRYLSLTKEK